MPTKIKDSSYETGIPPETAMEWGKANGFDAFKVIGDTCYVNFPERTIQFEYVIKERSENDGALLTEWRTIPLLVDPPAELIGAEIGATDASL